MQEHERRIRDTIRSMTQEAEVEIARAIAQINDKVVPEVRRSSSVGLRLAANQLQIMAEQLDPTARSRNAAAVAAEGADR